MKKRIIDADWLEELPCAITVCDRRYKILYMNGLAAKGTMDDGGMALMGKSLLDCHPPDARKRLKEVMASNSPNIYTVEKKGVRKMVNQSHWKKGGKDAGLLEMVFVLPKEVPHRVRT